jgi:CCR4-NOT transcription complex subunit 4
MTAEDLEEKLGVAKEAAVFAETEMREMMVKLQELRPQGHDEHY